MYTDALTTGFSSGACGSGWGSTLDRIVARAEMAEADLAVLGTGSGHQNRKASGSFYTPADVADHFWDQFFDLHGIADAAALTAWTARFRLVEPAAGAGMFVFTFLRRAVRMGLTRQAIAAIRFSVIDLNLAALRFVRDGLAEVERAIGVTLDGFALAQRDFLDWAAAAPAEGLAFVGNPPFVANPRGARWRNRFADFIDAMLHCGCRERTIAMILPMSVSFSRDFAELRSAIRAAALGIRAASYDNIPDCLFKSGKPDSPNSNKANSQRCTILMLGGPDPSRRQASAMLRWSVRDRAAVLGRVPDYVDFGSYALDGQFPRPADGGMIAYLDRNAAAPRLGDLLDRRGLPLFSVAAVARNFIGIREPGEGIDIATARPDDGWTALRIVSSPEFYRYWLTIGDGFHVTREVIARFPIAPEMLAACAHRAAAVADVWERRAVFAREKRNAGRLVRSYDLRAAF